MKNTLFDPTALLDDAQRAWLEHTRAVNRTRFAGWSMKDDDQDDDGDDGDDDKSDDDQDGDADDKSDDGGDDDVAAKLEAQKRINRNLERRTRRDQARIKALEAAQAKKTADKDGDDDKVDVDEIKAAAQAEARAEALHGRVEDKIEAKAKDFADPEDAVAVLLRKHDINDFIDDGKVDVDAIADALKELGEEKPHLLAQGDRFKGDADGGRRKGKTTGRPKTLADAVTQRYDQSR